MTFGGATQAFNMTSSFDVVDLCRGGYKESIRSGSRDFNLVMLNMIIIIIIITILITAYAGLHEGAVSSLGFTNPLNRLLLLPSCDDDDYDF